MIRLERFPRCVARQDSLAGASSVQFVVMFVVATVISSAANALEPTAGSNPAVELLASPQELTLSGHDDRQQFVIQAIHADGSTQDITDRAQIELRDPNLAKLEKNQIQSIADGQTQLSIAWRELSCTLPVGIVKAQSKVPLSFRNHVLPILTRSGCNTGKCHGSASGKDGFRLSLFGYDPDGDHYRLTREMPGRRISIAAPADCLVVNKATGTVPHTGGKRIRIGTEHYRQIVSWIAAGAARDRESTPIPERIEVLPRRAVFPTSDCKQQLIVKAHYSDGSHRDVTDLAVFLGNNTAAATVTENGLVASTGPGTAFILARFDKFTEGASILVRPGTPYQFPEISANNYIDELVFGHHRSMHLIPSELCSDEVFLRRSSIDLIGLLPSSEDRTAFLSNQNPKKRETWIEQLIERPEFLDLWVMKWAEMLQIRAINGVSPKGLQLYDRWLRDRFHSGTTIDAIIAELIPASGGTFDNPATSYYQTETTPQLLAENLAQSFLGTRIQCAQCHNHPFDRWTMDDYYGFASFFSQIGYKQAKDPREVTIYNLGTGSIKHPVSGREVMPQYLGGSSPQVAPGGDRRQALANWLTSPNNARFARNLANVVWSHFFGIGIVEPVDDLRISNPPSNPRLFEELGNKLVAYQFDIKPLVRHICRSKTYQLSTQGNSSNAGDDRNFSKSHVRRMRAEVLLDCINQVTQTEDRFSDLRPGSRAVQLADGRTPNYFLTTFGRSTRETACACAVSTSPTLSQALHLLNGETTTGKIEEGQVIDRLIARKNDPLLVVESLYERCFTRLPSPDERAQIQQRLVNSQDLRSDLVDLFWAMLNSNEFIFNH